jgi:hypothetical protein
MLPHLPDDFHPDDLMLVHIFPFAPDGIGGREYAEGHAYHVWLEARPVVASVGSRFDTSEPFVSVPEFERDIMDHEEARAYAWQIAAKYKLDVLEL